MHEVLRGRSQKIREVRQWRCIYKCVPECSISQSFLTLCNSMYCSPIGSSIHVIFLARVLEWFATHSSVLACRTSWTEGPCWAAVHGVAKSRTQLSDYHKVKVKVKSFSRVWLFATSWTTAYWVPPSMGFSGQGYWNGLPFPSPEDLPDPGIEPRSPALQADTLPSEPLGKPYIYMGKPIYI